MTFIKLSTYVISTTLSTKRAKSRLKVLLTEDILETEDAFNLDFFVEQLCSGDLEQEDEEMKFTLLDQEEALLVRDIDIEYTDDDIDVLVNDILFSKDESDDYEENIDEDIDSDDYDSHDDYGDSDEED